MNRIRIIYNNNHPPYLYGSVGVVEGSTAKFGSPFVISKRFAGQEKVYGTVKRIVEKIHFHMIRFSEFNLETRRKLEREGVLPIEASGNFQTLPDSEITEQVLEDQENLTEDVLTSVSIYVRILSEIFPNKMGNYRVDVYDYHDKKVDEAKLSDISNLILHNRYILVKDQMVVDLISDKKYLSSSAQMGLKLNSNEYFSEVNKVVTELTVKDLIWELWKLTKNVLLSTSPTEKEIVFLIQNLYTLGGSILEDSSENTLSGGPLKTILDRFAENHLQRFPSISEKQDITMSYVQFTTPRFCLIPDQNGIRTSIEVNGREETLDMGYEEFFQEVIDASGGAKLFTPPDS